MTIGELIRILGNHPPDMRVVVNGYEEGYDDLSPEQIAGVRLLLNTGTQRWQGRHGDPRDVSGPSKSHSESEDALLLGRVSN